MEQRLMKLPHRNRERELMDNGKPLAYLFPHQTEELAKFGDEFLRSEHVYRGTTRWLLCRPSEAWRIDAFKDVYKKVADGALALPDAHRELGRLVGYVESDIEEFVRRRGSEPLS